jgi:hypothetical protein
MYQWWPAAAFWMPAAASLAAVFVACKHFRIHQHTCIPMFLFTIKYVIEFTAFGASLVS